MMSLVLRLKHMLMKYLQHLISKLTGGGVVCCFLRVYIVHTVSALYSIYSMRTPGPRVVVLAACDRRRPLRKDVSKVF
jgi:hypothetical protein